MLMNCIYRKQLSWIKLGALIAILTVSEVNCYETCYYCKLDDLGHCAKYEIQRHRKICENPEPQTCNTISTITVHAGEGETYLKHCNETISVCNQLLTNQKTEVLFCCSKCEKSRGNGARSKSSILLGQILSFITFYALLA
ncbi:uncharacterized protein LOC120346728 [Styela clava]